jgi:hypothetical protein
MRGYFFAFGIVPVGVQSQPCEKKAACPGDIIIRNNQTKRPKAQGHKKTTGFFN